MEYQRYYCKYHKNGPEYSEKLKSYYNSFLHEFISKISKGAVLDMGCGMGIAMEYLKSKGFDAVIGFDRDEGQIQTCLSKGLKVLRSDNIDYVLNKFPGPYSLILALDFLEHLPKDKALTIVSKIAKHLNGEGIFICTVPNANSIFAGRHRYNDFTHFSSYTENSLDFLLFNAGFKKIQILPYEIRNKPSIKKGRIKDWLSWYNFKIVRYIRRWQAITELGKEGRTIPLSLNLLGVAEK